MFPDLRSFWSPKYLFNIIVIISIIIISIIIAIIITIIIIKIIIIRITVVRGRVRDSRRSFLNLRSPESRNKRGGIVLDVKMMRRMTMLALMVVVMLALMVVM